MTKHRLFCLALGCLWALAASAQYQWVDKSGRKVFSDQPPPADIPQKDILRQPGAAPRPAAVPAPSGDAAAGAPKAASSAPRLSGVDKGLEEKKKQAEDAEAAKKRAQDEQNAKQRAENCNRARSSKADFDSGMRIARTNAQGEREFIDDDTRAAEAKRLQGIIASDCK